MHMGVDFYSSVAFEFSYSCDFTNFFWGEHFCFIHESFLNCEITRGWKLKCDFGLWSCPNVVCFLLYLYLLSTVHEDVWKVLRRYSQSVVQVIPWALPGYLPNDPEKRSEFLHAETWQRRRLEVLPYNHCLYENLNRFHFIVPLDVDEVIFPIEHSDWKSLLDRVLFKQHGLLDTVASFAVQNTYFFTNWNLTTYQDRHNDSYTSFLDINYRTANFSQVGHSVKSFVNTKVARTVFNHYALSKLLFFQIRFLPSIV